MIRCPSLENHFGGFQNIPFVYGNRAANMIVAQCDLYEKLWGNQISCYYKLLRIPYFILAHILGNKVIANQYIKVLHKYCKYKGKKFGGILGEDTHIYASEWFDETEMMSFEGYAFPVPHEYDLVLRTYYGNYMQMPKCEDRVGHSEQAYYR